MSSSLVLAVLLAMLAASRDASAAPSTRLVYARGHGAEACPDEATLRHAVASRVGYDPFFPWAPLTVTVEMTRESGRVRARILVLDEAGLEKGAQSLESTGAGCDDLLESTALAVAVALDALPTPPKPSEESSDPSPAPAAPAPSPVAPLRSLPPVATWDAASERPHESGPRAFSLWAAPGARANVGAWKAASFGPDLFVELRRAWLGFGAEGRYDVASVSVGTSAQVNVQRATGSVLPCGHFGWFVTCGVATFGELRARGEVTTPRTASDAYVALGGRVGADVPILSKIHLLGTFDVVGVATGTVIQVDGGRSSTTMRPAEVSGGIALLVPIL